MKEASKKIETLTAEEKSIARHVLLGESIVDSLHLTLAKREAVDQFLKTNEFDWNDSEDRRRLQSIHNEAVSYLESILVRRLDKSVAKPDDIRELFSIAAQDESNRPFQLDTFPPSEDLPLTKQACLLLKVMNIIHHINGHELLYSCPISRRQIAQKVDDKIGRELSRLKASGFPLTSFEGGRKPKESLITKLLCKRTTIASRINDRLRYQIIVPEKKDLVSLVVELFSTVLPCNYLMPGTTINQLIDPDLVMSSQELISHKARDMAHSIARSVSHLLPHSLEEVDFTGSDYRILKFVVDVPVRIDTHTAAINDLHTTELGVIIFSLVEMTLVDEATHAANQRGANAHDQYKSRQKRGALQRMLGGKLE